MEGLILQNNFIRLLFLLLLSSCTFGNLSFGASSFLQSIDTINGLNYPVPPHDNRILFYVQRSNNVNAIVYETNLNKDGTINREEPVHVYWKRYTSDSSIAELNYIQRKYAYGIESKEIEGKNGQFILNFVSYDKKKFYLLPDRDKGGYQALTMINGKMAILERVFILLSGGTFWFPTISNIELKGRDPLTKQIVIENFKP